MNVRKKTPLKACNTFQTLAYLSCKCGVVVELVTTLACHAGGRGFKSLPSRHFIFNFLYILIFSIYFINLNIFAVTEENSTKKGISLNPINNKSQETVKVIALEPEAPAPRDKSKDKFNFDSDRQASSPFQPSSHVKTATRFLNPDMEIIDNVFKTINIEYELKFVSWQNLESMLRNGVADIALGMEKTSETLKFADFPKTPMRSREYFFYGRMQEVKKNTMTFKDVLEHNYNIGILTGYNYPQQFWKIFPFDDNLLNSHITESKDYIESIRQLKYRNIDLFMGEKGKTNNAIRELGADEVIFKYRNILYWYEFYCAFSKKSKLKNQDELKRKIERALYEMDSNGKLKEINERWNNES